MTMEQIQAKMFERVPGKVLEKLSKSRIGIAGLGGLGSNIAWMLARTGTPTLVLVDFDRVEPGNLNRQQYFPEQIGMLKTKALKENLMKINPWLNIELYSEKVTEENSCNFFSGCQVVCEALDDAAAKADFITGMLGSKEKIPVVAASGMAGIGDANRIQTVKKMNHLYVCGDEESDYQEVEGMLAPRVNLVAAHQANQVIRILMGEEQ